MGKLCRRVKLSYVSVGLFIGVQSIRAWQWRSLFQGTSKHILSEEYMKSSDIALNIKVDYSHKFVTQFIDESANNTCTKLNSSAFNTKLFDISRGEEARRINDLKKNTHNNRQQKLSIKSTVHKFLNLTRAASFEIWRNQIWQSTAGQRSRIYNLKNHMITWLSRDGTTKLWHCDS